MFGFWRCAQAGYRHASLLIISMRQERRYSLMGGMHGGARRPGLHRKSLPHTLYITENGDGDSSSSSRTRKQFHPFLDPLTVITLSA